MANCKMGKSFGPVLALVWTLTLFAKPLPPDQAVPVMTEVTQKLALGQSLSSLNTLLPGIEDKLGTALSLSKRYWSQAAPPPEFLQQYGKTAKTILERLGAIDESTAGVTPVYGGVMHSYGYYIIPIQTKYGPKSKRWMLSRIDERLGLRPYLFNPLTEDGEFLSNLTVTVSQIIPGLPKVDLKSAAPGIALTLKQHPPEYLGQVVEKVSWITRLSDRKTATIRTSLVSLSALPGMEDTDTTLLVYTIENETGPRIVTAFPINDQSAQQTLKSKPGKGTAFTPQNNLYIDPKWTVIQYTSSGFLEGHGK